MMFLDERSIRIASSCNVNGAKRQTDRFPLSAIEYCHSVVLWIKDDLKLRYYPLELSIFILFYRIGDTNEHSNDSVV